MLAIYWEPKSAFQNTFCRYSTIAISKHNNSTTVKPSGHLSLRHSWAPVTVPEALPVLRPGKMPVLVRYLPGILLGFYRYLSGILCRDFTGQVPACLIEMKIRFTHALCFYLVFQPVFVWCWSIYLTLCALQAESVPMYEQQRVRIERLLVRRRQRLPGRFRRVLLWILRLRRVHV